MNAVASASIEKRLIGHVACDSGRLILGDPGNITDELLQQHARRTGPVIERGVSVAVVVNTGSGTGWFPVYGLFERGTFVGIEVDTRARCVACDQWLKLADLDRTCNLQFCSPACEADHHSSGNRS